MGWVEGGEVNRQTGNSDYNQVRLTSIRSESHYKALQNPIHTGSQADLQARNKAIPVMILAAV